jgi:predicted nucleotidyltransferase
VKRRDAFQKLRTICRRLDERDPERFPVVPVRLYLFGSLLTDKPDPSDVDLLFEFQDRPDVDPRDIAHRLAYGKPLSHDRAVTQLRRGMKMIRVEFLTSTLEGWLKTHTFSPDTPIRMVWEPGLAWQEVVDEIEAHAIASWNLAAEERHKQVQETFQRIVKERGLLAAEEWLEEQVEQELSDERVDSRWEEL